MARSMIKESHGDIRSGAEMALQMRLQGLYDSYTAFESDDEAMTRRRLKQANLFGPAGFVTAEDGEVIVRSQKAFDARPQSQQIREMGLGRPELDPDKITTLITEQSIRSFYNHYRQVIALTGDPAA